ncbi:MAG: LysR family transcriptional regulator [Rubrivivax sp.]|nr:MAG: LysR family transcriptional regulator [Rubrivivax sp.]
MKNTNWDDIRLLISVSEQGSLLDAGRAQGIATTTVSRRIANLEKSLGAHLIHRTYGGTLLTDAGRRLVDATASVAIELDASIRGAIGSDQALEGAIKVTIVEGLAPLMVEAVQQFRLRNPNVTFELDQANRPLDISKGEADIALRTVRPGSQGLVVRQVGTIHFGVYGARSRFGTRIVAPGRDLLSRCDAVVLGGELQGLKETQWLSSRVRLVALQTPTLSSLMAAVSSGVGVGVIPDEFAAKDPSLHRLCSCEAVPKKALWLVMNRRTARTARVRAFAEHVAQYLRDYVSA